MGLRNERCITVSRAGSKDEAARPASAPTACVRRRKSSVGVKLFSGLERSDRIKRRPEAARPACVPSRLWQAQEIVRWSQTV